MKFIFFSFFSIVTITSFSQKSKKIAVEIDYGLAGNFFVKAADYGTTGGPSTSKYYKKDFIGSIHGLELKYSLNKNSILAIGFENSVNSKVINFKSTYINSSIQDWRIYHHDIFYNLFYERNFVKSDSKLKYHVGIFYLRMTQQEIDIIDRPQGGIIFEERNFKNSKLEEAGAFVGLEYAIKIDTKFYLGIRSRLYYLISTSSLEALTLTPTLTYTF